MYVFGHVSDLCITNHSRIIISMAAGFIQLIWSEEDVIDYLENAKSRVFA